ncbi:MAG: hypothetical protein PHP69_07275 [Candidatus Omnitrophica bacterium]|nr:hypothetical protein [Candidatus Omnitrophota bacterium]MDD5441730.1 hypothetical protein [Candidatus Omnitrophota bacterium]
MKYLELRNLLKDFTVFSLRDISMVDKTFHRRRLNEWQDKGYIKMLVKGYYIFSDLEINENVLFEISNRIYNPSYISFETALSFHGLIPESVYGITSATSRRTYKFQTKIGKFSYRTLSPKFFFGYDIVKYNDKSFKIATLEKVLLDYFYINPQIKARDHFLSLRINKDVLAKRLCMDRLNEFSERFNKKSLSMRLKIFLEVMKDA